MAFYKLFYLLHRRTDWPNLLDLEKQFMMPEQYAAAKRQAEILIFSKSAGYAGMGGITPRLNVDGSLYINPEFTEK